MANITANISGRGLYFGGPYSGAHIVLPSGGSLIDTITTVFSGSDWSGVSKKASFWRKDAPDQVRTVDVTNNSVTIPAEVVATPGLIYVAFAGETSSGGSARTARITTNAAAIVIEQGYKPEARVNG